MGWGYAAPHPTLALTQRPRTRHLNQRIVLDKKKLGATDGRPGLSLWGVMQAAIIHGALPTFIASGELWRSSLGSVFNGTKSAVELQIKQKNRGRSKSIGPSTAEKKKINGLVQRITNRAEEVWYGDDTLAQKVVQSGDSDWFLPTALSGYLFKVRSPLFRALSANASPHSF